MTGEIEQVEVQVKTWGKIIIKTIDQHLFLHLGFEHVILMYIFA